MWLKHMGLWALHFARGEEIACDCPKMFDLHSIRAFAEDLGCTQSLPYNKAIRHVLNIKDSMNKLCKKAPDSMFCKTGDKASAIILIQALWGDPCPSLNSTPHWCAFCSYSGSASILVTRVMNELSVKSAKQTAKCNLVPLVSLSSWPKVWDSLATRKEILSTSQHNILIHAFFIIRYFICIRSNYLSNKT